jgi:hypothetical protein
MNPLNSATLEASKRLVDKGIVLETDHYYCPIGLKDGDRNNRSPENIVYEIRYKDGRFACGLSHDYYKRCIPAPSMAEVWRELPGGVQIHKWRGVSIAGDGKFILLEKGKYSTNPTDALIELLIWLKEQRKEN